MKKIIFLPLTLLILINAGCERIITEPDESVKPSLQLSGTEQQITEADNAFGWTVLRELVATTPTANHFISPLSISMALGMTLNGARNQTYTDMKDVLGYGDMSQEEVNQAYRHLIELLTDLDPEVMFEIANSIWTRKGFPVEQDFYDVNRSYFDAEVRMLDFSLPEAPDIINGWIADKTHDKIQDVIQEIDPDVIMYLINAIYFNGTWTYEFDKEHTGPQTFYLSDNSTVQTPMMTQTNDFLYYEDDAVQVIDLPYGNGAFSMTVVLPGQDTPVTEFVTELAADTWNGWINGMEKKKGTITIPKLKMDWKALLNGPLGDMGMGVAFTDQANFTGINPRGGLYISRVIHQTFLEVDEEGTEAAAVTVVEMELTSVGPHNDLNFVMTVNRPYLLVIRERSSNTILFAGAIQQPEWEE